MAKLLFFTAVTLAIVVLSTAELDNPVQQHCQRQVQETSLEKCQQVVDHQLAVQLPFFHPRSSLLRSSDWRIDVRGKCCQQLRHVSPECRAAAIRQIVRHYEQQPVAPLGEGSYYPIETYPQQEQGQEQQQREQGWQTSPQQWQHEVPYSSSQTYRPQQQQQQEVGVCGQQQQQGRRQPYPMLVPYGHQIAGQHEKQAARLRQLRVVIKARQVAAQLPAMCQLQGRAFSSGQY